MPLNKCKSEMIGKYKSNIDPYLNTLFIFSYIRTIKFTEKVYNQVLTVTVEYKISGILTRISVKIKMNASVHTYST